MDRNLVLALVLSVLIIVVFQLYMQAVSPPPAKKPPAKKEAVQRPKPPQAREAVEPGVPPSGPPQAEPSKTREVPAVAVTEAKEVKVTIDSLLYEAVLSSRGGRIISFKLKNYRTGLNGDSLVNLYDPQGPDTGGPTIMLTRADETLNDAELPYQYSSDQTSFSLKDAGAKKSITFKTTTSAGLTLAKTYTFFADRYAVDFSYSLTNDSQESRNYLVSFPWSKVYKGEGDDRFAWNSAEILLNGELKDYYFKDIRGDEEPSGKIQWGGLGDVYFFKALVFQDQPAHKVTLFKPKGEGIAQMWLRYGSLDLPPGKPVDLNLVVYLGPKERTALAEAGHDLSRALYYSNYVLLDVMSEYLMKFLRITHNGFQVGGIKVPGTGNWGLDIIILTVLIKILFIPLTHTSMKSMKRMQEIQPEIAKLREKFGNDKQALNKATMDLFKQYKVNPLGGCWPMFLQLPVFIALYQTLSYAIELRHAYFLCIPSIFLCIKDLSAPDPYYITPILMGGSMVLQQWMTPTTGDPMQKKMMLLMPVVFTYLFLTFPSGLVIYWLVSNILSIGQQLITNKLPQ
jgi:YidC/Oxa1 family membrane protein insertase